ncbi:hypothetical protein DITRI_Ditri01bG0182000 [Diplodiscus trichospermus]
MHPCRGKPPEVGRYKVNFDGATDRQNKCGGIGVIMRDEMKGGMFWGLYQGKFKGSMIQRQLKPWHVLKLWNFPLKLGSPPLTSRVMQIVSFKECMCQGAHFGRSKDTKEYVNPLHCSSHKE